MQWIRDDQHDAELWSLDYEGSSDPGNRCRLTPAQARLLYPTRLKGGRTQADLAVEFWIDQSSVSRYLKRIEKILCDKLPTTRYMMMMKLAKIEDMWGDQRADSQL